MHRRFASPIHRYVIYPALLHLTSLHSHNLLTLTSKYGGYPSPLTTSFTLHLAPRTSPIFTTYDQTTVLFTQILCEDMVDYLYKVKRQLQRPSDCALGFLTSLWKIMTSDLVGSHQTWRVENASNSDLSNYLCHALFPKLIVDDAAYVTKCQEMPQRSMTLFNFIRKVDKGDSSIMHIMRCAVLMALDRNTFADTSPSPGP